MNAAMAWRLHQLCEMVRRYPHEIVQTLTVQESADIAILADAIERELRKLPKGDAR